MTSEEGNLQLAQSYSPYGEELEEIGSEPVTFGYAGQLYDEQTGLLFLRARYYSPSNGRFISHDSWAGDAYMPMSYNMWLYGYGNPMRYTDPSGNFAIVDSLIAGLVGFATGAAVGATFGACTYNAALTGQCGCAMKQEAFSMSRGDWIGANALMGGIFGGVAAAFATIGPGFLIAVSGIGMVLSAVDFVDTVNIIRNQTGITPCTVGKLILDVAGMVFSGMGIAKGIKSWRASGSGLKWKSTSTVGESGVESIDTEPNTTQELYESLRKKSPDSSIRDMVNQDVQLPMDDPVLPGLKITKNLEADHIYPLRRIVELENFELLTPEQQLQVVNNPENFSGLSKSANASKGAKTYGDWDGHIGLGIEVDPQYKAAMIAREAEIIIILQNQINGFLNLR